MNRDQMLAILRSEMGQLRERGVKRLVLFGPVARNEDRPGSEVDFLLELEPPHTYDHFVQIRLYLESLIERPVELVVVSLQHPIVQPFIEQEMISIL